jgi:DNA-binding PadR family transcriptional regulator
VNDSDLVILGMLAEQPRHGYELEELIAARGVRNWTDIGFSSIYYVLKRLGKAGWVTSSLEEAERGPARKVYRLTPTGETALRNAVIEALSTPAHARTPILPGLANLPVLEPTEALTALEHYGTALEARLFELEQTRAAQQPLPFFVEAMFDHALALTRAELAWLEGVVARIGKREPKRNPLP